MVFKRSNAQNCSMCAIRDTIEELRRRNPRGIARGKLDICLLCCTRLTYMMPDLDTMGITASECINIFRVGVIKKRARKLVKEIKEEI